MKISMANGTTVVHDPEDFSPFPVAVRAGELIFVPGLMALENTELEISTWSSRAESSSMYDRLQNALTAVGGEVETIAYLIQNMVGRDKTVPVSSERPRRFLSGYPTSTAVGVTDVGSPLSSAQFDCVAYESALKQSFVRVRPATSRVGYSESLEVDGMVYLAGVMTTDQEVGVDPGRWSWSPLKEHVKWLVEHRLKPRLEQAGCTIEDIASIHCHLRDAKAELSPLIDVLKELFSRSSTLILISPASELHYVGGRIELTVTAVRPGSSRGKVSVALDVQKTAVFGGPDAIRIGEHIFCSTLVAQRGRRLGSTRSDFFDPPAAREMREILDQLHAIARASNGDLSALVRLRLYLENPAAAAPALEEIKKRVGTNVAVSFTSTREALGWISPNTIAADAVFFAPRTP